MPGFVDNFHLPEEEDERERCLRSDVCTDGRDIWSPLKDILRDTIGLLVVPPAVELTRIHDDGIVGGFCDSSEMPGDALGREFEAAGAAST